MYQILSCCIALGTISSHLAWHMVEDSVRKRMYICMCDRVTWLYNRKLTEHCKPTIMEKIKIIKKKIKCIRFLGPNLKLLKQDLQKWDPGSILNKHLGQC